MQPIAILSAMDRELAATEAAVLNPVAHDLVGRRFVTGTINDVPVVTTITGFGKVAAAAAAASVLHEFRPAALIFGGVAGGIHPDVRIGDVVIGDHLLQHDYDASPIYDPQVIPSLGVATIPADPRLSGRLAVATVRYLETRVADDVADVLDGLFNPGAMRMRRGLIGSGDQFISSAAAAADLHERFPDLLAVEMEGAAIAQVCAERDIPFAVFRLVSDRADQDAAIDFDAFVSSVAAPLVAGIFTEFLANLG